MSYPDDFLAFWEAYPKRKAKADAFKAWRQTAEDRPPGDEVVRAVRAQWVSEWQFSERKYIPHPATWLRAHRWEDDLEWCDWLANATDEERFAELAYHDALTPEQTEEHERLQEEARQREAARLQRKADYEEALALYKAGVIPDVSEGYREWKRRQAEDRKAN